MVLVIGSIQGTDRLGVWQAVAYPADLQKPSGIVGSLSKEIFHMVTEYL